MSISEELNFARVSDLLRRWQVQQASLCNKLEIKIRAPFQRGF